MEIPRYWRLNPQRYRMVGSICPTCGQISFPPRQICPDCAAQPVQLVRGGFSVVPSSNLTLAPVPSKGG